MPHLTQSVVSPPVLAATLPTAGGRWVAVTGDPAAAPPGMQACTPELAAWLVVEGLAVAVAAEGGAYPQLLHLSTRPRRRADRRGLASSRRAACPAAASARKEPAPV